MSLPDRIKQLIEERKAEAIVKQLSIKVRKICEALGQDILSAPGAGGWHDDQFAVQRTESLWDDFHGTNADGQLPEMPEDGISESVGKFVDLLSSGKNLQMYLLEGGSMVKVNYNSYPVLVEISGSIELYHPSAEWESVVNSLLTKAEATAKLAKSAEEEKQKKKNAATAKQVMDFLEKAWGISNLRGR